MSGRKGVVPRPYTEYEIRRAIRLQALGFTWAAVGKRLGRSEASIQATVSNYRLGKWAPKRRDQRMQRVRAELRAVVGEKGLVTLKDIAAATNAPWFTVESRLRTLGLDRFARDQLAQGRAV